MAIGVVTGMLAEARLLNSTNYRVVAAGGDPEATVVKAEQMVRDGVTALVSFGIAGALDPRLQPGELVIATGVILPDGRQLNCDATWQQRVQGKLMAMNAGAGEFDKVRAFIPGLVAGCSVAVASRVDKHALFRATGAVAVDMESHHVAAVASRHNLPFLIMRAVADTSVDEVPEAALVGLNKEGRPAIGAVLLSLLTNPWQIPALIRVALRSRAALNALLRSRAALL